ncbi:MAG: glycosyltransferase family 4 protein [Actinomycetota bacterium]|nr:glycosyltransferase family 4 protein [Actinomycetota bacterium]
MGPLGGIGRSSRPRIAYVTSSRGVGGGAERLLEALLAAGADRGWDQLLLNPFANEESVAVAELAELAGSTAYSGHRCDRWTDLPALRRWLRSELDAFRPDLLHVMLLQALLVTSTLRKKAPTKWLLTHVYGDVFAVRRFGRTYRALDRWAGRRFDRMVAISKAVEDFLVTDHGYPSEKVLCIQPGWEGEPRPRIDGGAPTVVCVAKMRPEKGHDTLLDAFDLVRRDVPDARLVLVGDGDLRPALEAKVDTLGLRGSVVFAGPVPDIWEHLAPASVFALASRSEAFGIALVEAMAAGLPVVAPAVGAIPEVVTSGVTGELYRPGDHRALADSITKILRSRELQREMGTKAVEAARDLHITRTVDRYFELYDALLSSNDGSRPQMRS